MLLPGPEIRNLIENAKQDHTGNSRSGNNESKCGKLNWAAKLVVLDIGPSSLT